MELPKILFIPTANSGVSYWRMWNFAVAMHRNRTAEARVQWYTHSSNSLAEWEFELQQARTNDDYATQWRITKEIDVWMRQSEAIVMGLCHSFASLDMFQSIIQAREDGHLRDVPIMMEIDDNILAVPTQNPAFHSYEPNTPIRDIAVRQMIAADGLIVSTAFLAEIYAEFNKNIHVIPNSIDFVHWGKVKKVLKPKVRIGWAGGSAHKDDLRILETVIPEILHKFDDVIFSFFHGNSPYLFEFEKKYPGKVEIVREWSDVDKYPQKIATQDWNIALAPLVDSSFNRAKSNLRWLEAGALGIPCVASNVGHFKETIRNGQDGVLCEESSDFVTALSAMLSNKKLRKAIGLNAKKRIATDFNVDNVSKTYVDILLSESNKIADRKVDAAIKDLKERENEQGPDTESCVSPCGRPAADEIRGLLQ